MDGIEQNEQSGEDSPEEEETRTKSKQAPSVTWSYAFRDCAWSPRDEDPRLPLAPCKRRRSPSTDEDEGPIKVKKLALPSADGDGLLETTQLSQLPSQL